MLIEKINNEFCAKIGFTGFELGIDHIAESLVFSETRIMFFLNYYYSVFRVEPTAAQTGCQRFF